MLRSVILSSLALVPPSARPLPAQETGDDPLEMAIVRLVEGELEEHDIAGLSLSIGVGDETYLAAGWGYSDPGVRAGADTPYRAGSLTTHLAAVAAVQLTEDGRLDLDADVGRYFPELGQTGEDDEVRKPEEGEVQTGVRIRDLLAQTSGLSDYSYASRRLFQGGHPSREALLSWLAAQPFEGEPGSCFGYSKTNTLLLGWIIEEVSGQELPRYFEERFFRPLQMEDTTYCLDAPTIHTESDAFQEVVGTLVADGSSPHPFAAEGLCTSAEDLHVWVRALVEGEVLSAASFEMLTAPRRLPDGSETGYGLGVSLTPLEDESCVSFGGGMAGSRLHAAYYPALDLTIAVLAADEIAHVDRIERRIARRFLRLDDPEIQDLPLEADELARYIGGYYEGCNRIEVREKRGHLELVPAIPGEKRMELLYQGDHRFVAAHDHEVHVTFELRGERVTGYLLSERGVERRAVRLD